MRRTPPPIIIVTWLMCAWQAVNVVIGVLRLIGQVDLVSDGEVSVLSYTANWLLVGLIAAVLVVTVYASVRREPWGRAVVVTLAAVLVTRAAQVAFVPHTSVFTAAFDPAQTLTRMASLLPLLCMGSYLGFVLSSTTLRDYFGAPSPDNASSG
ncbi:MAG: hypothetical protein ABWX83_10965 [Luteibacter sp.]